MIHKLVCFDYKKRQTLHLPFKTRRWRPRVDTVWYPNASSKRSRDVSLHARFHDRARHTPWSALSPAAWHSLEQRGVLVLGRLCAQRGVLGLPVPAPQQKSGRCQHRSRSQAGAGLYHTRPHMPLPRTNSNLFVPRATRLSEHPIAVLVWYDKVGQGKACPAAGTGHTEARD